MIHLFYSVSKQMNEYELNTKPLRNKVGYLKFQNIRYLC